MRKRRKRCVCCKDLYTPHSRTVKRQKTCKKATCKRSLKTDWQKTVRSEDEDYRANDVENSRAWRAEYPNYNRERRRKNSDEGVKSKKPKKNDESKASIKMSLTLNLEDGSCRGALNRDENHWEEAFRARIMGKRRCANKGKKVT